MLIESTENLIKNNGEEKACEDIAPALTAFLNALFTVKYPMNMIAEVESILSSILRLFQFVFSSPLWRYINNETLLSLLYSMQTVYSEVYAICSLTSYL